TLAFFLGFFVLAALAFPVGFILTAFTFATLAFFLGFLIVATLALTALAFATLAFSVVFSQLVTAIERLGSKGVFRSTGERHHGGRRHKRGTDGRSEGRQGFLIHSITPLMVLRGFN